MRNAPLPSVKTESVEILVSALKKHTQNWLMACEMDCAASTLANRRIYVSKLLWFLTQRELDSCGVHELRAFFAYIKNGHTEAGGRWGMASEIRPVKPATIAAYHRHLRACFNWLVGEGLIEASPFARIPAPDDRADTIDPFSDDQVNALLSAARHSHHPKRDEAILYFLLDTGIRASELCALRWRDVDMSARRAIIQEGKGGKSRPISFGKTAAKALFNYSKIDGRDDDDPLFTSAQGDALTRSGLLQLIERLAKAAAVRSVRCSPHTFRHTFAVSFLRNGGNQFSLMQQLGHTDLKMTSRYVKLAQADVARQHALYSPADALKGKRR